MKRFCYLLMALITLSPAFAAETPDKLATRILQAVGRPVGLAHLPRCGDGALALALAAGDTNMRLHGQDGDDARVLQARRAADEKEFRHVWFDHGDLARLLPAGRSADLVVLTDLKAGGLTPELAAEIRRVLHPRYGFAVLGGRLGEDRRRRAQFTQRGKIRILRTRSTGWLANRIPGIFSWGT